MDGLAALFGALRQRGCRLLGPTIRDRAIVYDDIETPADLPQGWTDEQDPGRYRLERRDDDALFGFAVGPQSWKRFLHPPLLTLWKARREGRTTEVKAEAAPDEPLALIGVRACETHAIAIQDRVLMGDAYVDPHYQARREKAFIVAVNCSKAGGTCFCASMSTGPKVEGGFDIALTEIIENGAHGFVVEVGSQAGSDILRTLPQRPLSE